MNLNLEQKTTLITLVNAEIASLSESNPYDNKIAALVAKEKERLKAIIEELSPGVYHQYEWDR